MKSSGYFWPELAVNAPTLTEDWKGNADIEFVKVTQCSALTNHLFEIIVAPQRKHDTVAQVCEVQPHGENLACHGNSCLVAENPFTILSEAEFTPHVWSGINVYRVLLFR